MSSRIAPYADTVRRLYTEQQMPLRKIAEILRNEYHVPATAMTVHKLLKRRGIDTAKSGSNIHKTVVCRTCGRPKMITRSRYRDATGRGPTAHRQWHHYCDRVCRRVWLEEHCRGQQAARRLVEYIMNKDLPADAVVHFIDDDTTNVIKMNLKVFTSTQRHIEEHRKMTEE